MFRSNLNASFMRGRNFHLNYVFVYSLMEIRFALNCNEYLINTHHWIPSFCHAAASHLTKCIRIKQTPFQKGRLGRLSVSADGAPEKQVNGRVNEWRHKIALNYRGVHNNIEPGPVTNVSQHVSLLLTDSLSNSRETPRMIYTYLANYTKWLGSMDDGTPAVRETADILFECLMHRCAVGRCSHRQLIWRVDVIRWRCFSLSLDTVMNVSERVLNKMLFSAVNCYFFIRPNKTSVN